MFLYRYLCEKYIMMNFIIVSYIYLFKFFYAKFKLVKSFIPQFNYTLKSNFLGAIRRTAFVNKSLTSFNKLKSRIYNGSGTFNKYFISRSLLVTFKFNLSFPTKIS